MSVGAFYFIVLMPKRPLDFGNWVRPIFCFCFFQTTRPMPSYDPNMMQHQAADGMTNNFAAMTVGNGHHGTSMTNHQPQQPPLLWSPHRGAARAGVPKSEHFLKNFTPFPGLSVNWRECPSSPNRTFTFTPYTKWEEVRGLGLYFLAETALSFYFALCDTSRVHLVIRSPCANA